VIVLDTHAWLWWVSDPARLSDRVREAIDRTDEVGVCTISCWEVAMLIVRGRIELDREVGSWVGQALAPDRVRALPLTPHIAVAAALLDHDTFAGDPADRIIYSSARGTGSLLATKDARIRSFAPRWTLW
jgi:PIN domain nuclease of toxin-antitoxin system